jgi:hypothetical protein
MKEENLREEVAITGYVIATDWGWDAEVSGIKIETHDDEYVVEPNGLGEELFNEIDSEVEVTGIVMEEMDGTKQITVTNYEVLRQARDKEDEYYGYDNDWQEFASEQGESPM